MRKPFEELTPDEILGVKKDYLRQRCGKANVSHAATEVTEAQAKELYLAPDYVSWDEVGQAGLESCKEYPNEKILEGKLITNSNGTKTFRFVPMKK